MDKIDERKIYEIGYLLAPYLPKENIAEFLSSLFISRIESAGGELTDQLEPVMTRLAYTITKIINNKHTKFSDAYFGALRFKVSPSMVVKLKESWSKEDDIVRFLLISLPKDSEKIIVPKRNFARQEEKVFEIERLLPEKEEETVSLSDEDLDKEIDKLVEPVA